MSGNSSHGHHHHRHRHLCVRPQEPKFSPSHFTSSSQQPCLSSHFQVGNQVSEVTQPPVGGVFTPYASGTTSPHLPGTTGFAQETMSMFADVFLKSITIKSLGLERGEPGFSWKPLRTRLGLLPTLGC